jgi:hypothetical protein
MRFDQERNVAGRMTTSSSSARRYESATHLSSSSIADQDELESRDVGRFRHGRRCYGGVVEMM